MGEKWDTGGETLQGPGLLWFFWFFAIWKAGRDRETALKGRHTDGEAYTLITWARRRNKIHKNQELKHENSLQLWNIETYIWIRPVSQDIRKTESYAPETWLKGEDNAG